MSLKHLVARTWSFHAKKQIQSGNKQQEHASGRTIRSCLAIRGYASAAGVTLVRQSSHSALHNSWRKYLPSSTHRLKPVNKHTTTFALARNIQQPKRFVNFAHYDLKVVARHRLLAHLSSS